MLFFFFFREFQLWYLLSIIALYRQTKTPISFLYKRELNLIFLIQPLEILLVELIGAHIHYLHCVVIIIFYYLCIVFYEKYKLLH